MSTYDYALPFAVAYMAMVAPVIIFNLAMRFLRLILDRGF